MQDCSKLGERRLKRRTQKINEKVNIKYCKHETNRVLQVIKEREFKDNSNEWEKGSITIRTVDRWLIYFI